MKIAVIIPVKWHSNDSSKFSVDLSLYVEAIIELGHEPLLVCAHDSVYQVDYQVEAIPTEEFEEKDFWLGLKIDVAIVFTWLRHAAILVALKSAGVYVVSRADSDGQVSVKVFPLHYYRLATNGLANPVARATSIRHWMRRYFIFSRRVDQDTLDSIAASDVVMIETSAAKQNLNKFLDYYHRADFDNKILVQAHYVSDSLLSCEAKLARRKKVVAIGRWDDPQKDSKLMLATLELYLKRYPEIEVVLIGRNGPEVFKSLVQKYANVHCFGVIPRSEIKDHISNCRIILFTSQWEGAPVSASETLALGGTVVGPPIPGIQGFCLDGQFGTVSLSRQPRHMVRALESEMLAWEQGTRKPQEITQYWRPKLSATNSIKMIIQMASGKQEQTRLAEPGE